MYFGTVDFEFLKLAGICRYIPSGLSRRYDTPLFSRRTIANLQEHRFIKLLSDKMSYKLTKRGRDILAEMGYGFTGDARTNLKKKSYVRKLKNAQWNILLSLAGINVYYKAARELENTDCGYMSCLTLRADKNMKVLSGTKFLGILKLYDAVYIPYYIEDETAWIYPVFERETFRSQADTIRNVKTIHILLTGESLEELWEYINTAPESAGPNTGRIRISKALEESGSDYSLVPFGRGGVMQMNIMKIFSYRKRLAGALGCSTDKIPSLADCDGMRNHVPYIIAIDFDIKRIVRALKQIEKYDTSVVPRICCLSFQKSTMYKLLEKYGTQKIRVSSIDTDFIHKVFPEIDENKFEAQPFRTKEGEYIEIPERRLTKDEIEYIEE